MVELLGIPLPLFLLIVGVLLGIGEAIAPGAHLIVLGVALIVAGLLGLVMSTWITGALLTAAMAVTILLAGSISLYLYRELDLYKGKGRGRTKDSASLRGATGRVTERVTPTGGEVKLNRGGFNPIYRARSASDEIAEGQEVIVVDPGGGNVLQVESITGEMDEIDRELAKGRRNANAERSDELESA